MTNTLIKLIMNNFIDNDETNNKFILEINYLRNINNADNNMVPEKTKLTSKLFKNGKGNNYIISKIQVTFYVILSPK